MWPGELQMIGPRENDSDHVLIGESPALAVDTVPLSTGYRSMRT